jgi:hypothetical protein
MDVDVVHVPDRSRFEARVEGQTAYLTYAQEGSTVAMTHTIVPPEIGGPRDRRRAHPHRGAVGPRRRARGRPPVLLRAQLAEPARLTGQRRVGSGRMAG